MRKTKKELLRIAAVTAAIVITAGTSLTLQKGVVQPAFFTEAADEESDFNYTTETSGNLTYAKYSDHIS